ncbi:hypothetical protein DAI22_03g308100 [Oryza sativa Japonica Group]|nr:hypothetical protein DAI22_03g308100 [Oryza sativa Japonica Group]
MTPEARPHPNPAIHPPIQPLINLACGQAPPTARRRVPADTGCTPARGCESESETASRLGWSSSSLAPCGWVCRASDAETGTDPQTRTASESAAKKTQQNGGQQKYPARRLLPSTPHPYQIQIQPMSSQPASISLRNIQVLRLKYSKTQRTEGRIDT